MSNLPDLPAGFGRDSAYPPMPTRVTPEPSYQVAPMARTQPVPRLKFMTAPDEDPLPAPPPAAVPRPPAMVSGIPKSSSYGDVSSSSMGDASPSAAETHPPADLSPQMPSQPGLRRPASQQPLRPSHHLHASYSSYPFQPLSPPPATSAASPPRPPARSPPRPSASPATNSAQVASPEPAAASPPRLAPAEAPRPAPTELPRTSATLPTIRVPLPDIESLEAQKDRADRSGSEVDQLRWSVQLLKWAERQQASGAPLEDPVPRWVEEAIAQIVQIASHPTPSAEALYARGDLLAGGHFPAYVAKDLRSAFSDFERSARMGWAPSWFRIGRDYETLGDIARAKTAYGRGVQMGDVSCLYRMGIAKALGQLELPQDLTEGMSLLQMAADAATVDAPHPAFIYGLILAGELSHVPVPLEAFADPTNPAPTRESLAPLARQYIERAAYLNLAAAQSKCGWCYEHAQLSFPFDPLLSVQYYSAASQGGEPEADMSLSKWFLCGAEGCFDKNEDLAYTFAERAARHHLPTAEFAMGYYNEVGIGTPVNLASAREWYTQAAAQGNQDAKDRLARLQASLQSAVSRAQHQQHLDERLYSAHQRARNVSGESHERGDLARSRTMLMAQASAQRRQAVPASAGPRASRAGPAPRAPRPPQTPQTFSDMGYQPKSDKDCVIS
ncbi:Similar to S.cerevisiae protein SKT5 (Activator of Chs3p (chitin synthase III) during vegetative growth) [Malassezia sympodialis ATCC 42132]|uniref:Similar to S.cerevisiae protein SKT5 (Activator of Chs3p (Chitin synthase III) during vegetative growth) n=1 Tax=Malassezia sympodialis (strain ATCC 42132) TaxID=1230383 RepID=A0A1M8A7L7_MALS4|nr:Similar to S.cerevisiae protein SKT5 (Activator of Chs3p (chitin synthase III) during vegetative growth) [Malassezia sympodialis ATCC 42132]